ncbi:mannitol dehydrogenase family protein [Altererythrobacter aurantiacus]|uniref:Mannitol dehydrogenase family protein n=1 Tax=Parapontixanthobacter aurantiacus TaxID=1463599 RepID=A0A844ZAB7_9SPHN|nr:mannitol dehydrogenase family protein [Parapontixanthobacter aurantiacus]
MRLSSETLAALPAEIDRFAYDRAEQEVGIVHYGIGAFHRAHQAWYTDLAMDRGDCDWMICGVSMRSKEVANSLNPQDGLYTLTARTGSTSITRVIGSVREVLFAPDEADAVVDRIAAPACRIVSFTVTEKGYARAFDGSLDIELARQSFYSSLARGLKRRMDSDLPGVTLLSCDNLADNGALLSSLVREWIRTECPELEDWFERKCTVPSTMVDRIVPRTSPADVSTLADTMGMEDLSAVFTEPFSQWVIEDEFANGRPAWDSVGAQLVEDVQPYEMAKLRILNGAHSFLAYAGLREGHEFVHEAIRDPALREQTERLMEEAASTVDAPSGLDLAQYRQDLIARFAEPSIRHRLSQIAMDGSQKLPQRWLDTALQYVRTGKEPKFFPAALDCWLWHLEDGRYVDDPHGEELTRLMQAEGRSSVIARCFFGSDERPALWHGYSELVSKA